MPPSAGPAGGRAGVPADVLALAPAPTPVIARGPLGASASELVSIGRTGGSGLGPVGSTGDVRSVGDVGLSEGEPLLLADP